LGKTVSKTDQNHTDQKWTTGKTVGTLVVLTFGVVATFFVPIELLKMAGDAIEQRELADAEMYKAWSYGLVVLGPSLLWVVSWCEDSGG
jgi:hypothetical protein